MRVLVTGGHGFVGSHVVDRLLAGGDRVRCLLRRPGLPETLAGKDVEVVRGDVRDASAAARALRGVDEVYHLAALTRSLTRRAMLETNLGGTRTLLAALARARPSGRFLLCSSLAAAGPAPGGRWLDEAAPCRPVTWYGESKRLAEEATRAAGIAATIVRPPAVYGPRDRDFLPVFQAAARGLRPALGERPSRYHFVYVEDLAAAIVAAARAEGTVGGTYYAAHPEVLTAEAFAGHVARAVGRPTRPLRVPSSTLALAATLGELAGQVTGTAPLLNRQRLIDLAQPAWLCSAAALERDAGWRPRTDAAEGTRRTASWYRARGRLAGAR